MHSGDAGTPAEKLAAAPARSGATGPCGSSSTAGTRFRGGSIDGREHSFHRDTLFVL